ncbi:hypothetical protein KY358_07155 [Candidatus Woesearchaeota archaeon]|nr:hypothetical protein [Candidatus Woesearchaeota archaeon]
MIFAQKEFSYYWKIIRVPLFILVAWSILGLIISLFSFSLYSSIFSPLAGWLLILSIFGFIGWTTIKDYGQKAKVAAWAGALAGAIFGFIGSLVSILMFHLVPEVVQSAIAQAGENAAAVEGFIAIGIYLSAITVPVIYAIVGAMISAMAALIAKKL